MLDNVDDHQFLLDQATITSTSKTSAKSLHAYLPQSERGSILLTSRSRDSAQELVEQRDIILVEPMNEALALTLFEKKLGNHGDVDAVAELAAALEYMPLAIVQAASYIVQRAPRCSVAQYLDMFRRSDHDKMSLLNYEAGRLRRDPEARNSILITWQISFEHLRQSRPSAAELLS